VFDHLTFHGGTASLLWGYRTAAVFRTWKIYKHEGQWMLAGTLVRVEPFMCRQKGLLFTAPHEKGRDGFWAWAVLSLDVGTHQLLARLGPPEQ
jgi:hypothetical protein